MEGGQQRAQLILNGRQMGEEAGSRRGRVRRVSLSVVELSVLRVEGVEGDSRLLVVLQLLALVLLLEVVVVLVAVALLSVLVTSVQQACEESAGLLSRFAESRSPSIRRLTAATHTMAGRSGRHCCTRRHGLTLHATNALLLDGGSATGYGAVGMKNARNLQS